MRRSSLVILTVLVACNRTDRAAPTPCPPCAAAAPCPPIVDAAVTAGADCAGLVGANPVQTEMRRLECALAHAVSAIGRDDLPAIAHQLHIVHQAKEATGRAIAAGTWKPATGDVQAFVALDQAFHRELEALVEGSLARDHAATSAALGRTMAACQGCHATFRPAAPAP